MGSVVDSIRERFWGAPKEREAPSVDNGPDDSTKKAIFDFKKEALGIAAEQALARGEKPTIIDYYIAAQKVGEKHAEEIANRSIEWTPQVIADLSGQRITGFNINKADMEPSPELRRAAVLLATSRAENGAAITLTDSLTAMQDIQSGKAPDALKAGIKSLKDMADLDGDGAINDFFSKSSNTTSFKNTVLESCTFHPAGTLMRNDESGVAITDGSVQKNCVYDGMTDVDHVILAKGTYTNPAFTNIKSGHIQVANNTIVHGMDLQGIHAELTFGVIDPDHPEKKANVLVTGLNVTNAHIVTMTAAPGVEISGAVFDSTTIDMASTLAGSKWSDTKISRTNLAHLEMDGVEVNRMTVTQSAVKGWDLRGTKINDLAINGVAITDAAQLSALGVQADERTTIAASKQFVMQAQLDQIRETMQGVLKGVNPTAEPVGTAPAPAISPLESLAAQATLRFEVARTSLDEAQNGGRNPAKDQVARTQPDQVMGRTLNA
ncbi:MAG: hypothetical protein V4735_09185 [Pseudomonadota bacterium]